MGLLATLKRLFASKKAVRQHREDKPSGYTEAFLRELNNSWKSGELLQIHTEIRDNPGISSIDLRKRLGLNKTVLAYALRHLQQLGFISSPNYKQKAHNRQLYSNLKAKPRSPYLKVMGEEKAP